MVEVSFQHPRQAAFPRQGIAAVLLLVGLALSGCSDQQATATPLDWWHNLEGGVIAGQRPPPPGSNDPYPNISTIPPRPPPADVAAQQAIADSLATQRDSANLTATKDPLKTLSSPPPAPPKPAAPNPDANKVVVDAAAPAPTPPARPAATPTPPPTPAALPSIDSVPAVPAAVASGPLPDFAAAPPPLPTGFDLPATPTAPVPPPPPKARTSTPANSVVVSFTPDSSTLPPSAPLRLQQFAVAHKGAIVTVTGHGDAVLMSADSQGRALGLALQRAQSIAAFLVQAGMPATTLRLHAEATGDTGTVALN